MSARANTHTHSPIGGSIVPGLVVKLWTQHKHERMNECAFISSLPRLAMRERACASVCTAMWPFLYIVCTDGKRPQHTLPDMPLPLTRSSCVRASDEKVLMFIVYLALPLCSSLLDGGANATHAECWILNFIHVCQNFEKKFSIRNTFNRHQFAIIWHQFAIICHQFEFYRVFIGSCRKPSFSYQNSKSS